MPTLPVNAIRERGGKVVREAGPMKHGTTVIAFVEDPDGYKIELIQRNLSMAFPAFFDDVPPIVLRDPLAEIPGAAENGLIEYRFADAGGLAGHSCPPLPVHG